MGRTLRIVQPAHKHAMLGLENSLLVKVELGCPTHNVEVH